MVDTENNPQSTQPVNGSEALCQERIAKLEEALAEYIERYGLTDKAREAFRYPKR